MPAINHVGLTVANVERSTRFYRSVGFELIQDDVIDYRGSWLSQQVGHEDAHLKVQLLKLGDAMVELIEYAHPVGGKRTPLGTNDAGSAHLAIEVEDVATLYEQLSAEGVTFVSSPVTLPDGDFAGTVTVYAHDPDGNICELINMPNRPV